MRLHLQYFGGRGSGSGMTASSGSSAPMTARDQYDAAKAERTRLADIRPSERTDEQRQQLKDAFKREAEAAYSIVSEMSDDAVQGAANKYMEYTVNHPFDSDKEMRRWIRSMSGTKKDGTPTQSAIDGGMKQVSSFMDSRRGLNLYADPYSDANDKGQKERLGRALAKAASKYKDRF